MASQAYDCSPAGPRRPSLLGPARRSWARGRVTPRRAGEGLVREEEADHG
jgi:hypothetical protein